MCRKSCLDIGGEELRKDLEGIERRFFELKAQLLSEGPHGLANLKIADSFRDLVALYAHLNNLPYSMALIEMAEPLRLLAIKEALGPRRFTPDDLHELANQDTPRVVSEYLSGLAESGGGLH